MLQRILASKRINIKKAMFSLPGIALLILNLSGRWRPVVNLPSPLFAPRKEPRYTFNGRLDALERRKMRFPYRHLNPGLSNL
jgi:hypothetical protein